MKKIIFVLAALVLSVPFLAQARMPAMYPIYGYNSAEHICQVKQGSETSQVRQGLSGEYWNLRACRSNNPEILFFTGLGIVIWIILFATIFLKHFHIKPSYLSKKQNSLEKKIGVLWDLAIVFLSIFILILFLHYFDVPSSTYNYKSDIDHIIYNVLIDARIPTLYLGFYITISIMAFFRKRN